MKKGEFADRYTPAVIEAEVDRGDAGTIPQNLETLTESVVRLHRENGDLGWLREYITQFEPAPAA